MSKANSVERLMLELINEARADAGLAPLKLALDLNESADDHSAWMLRQDTFSHTGAGGSNAGERMADAGFDFTGSWSWGENIAWQSERGRAGTADDVEDLFQSLMNSPGHRANILSAGYDYVGIGVKRGDLNGWDAVMVTQNFASTSAPVALDTGAGGGTPNPPAPNPPAPDPPTANAAPVIEMADITVARVNGKAKKAWVKDALDVFDADGDEIVYYKIRDTEGRQNFVIKGEGKVNARDPYRIDAEDIDNLLVRRDKSIGDSGLEIRAYDGEDWSDWTEFTLHTLAPEDFFA